MIFEVFSNLNDSVILWLWGGHRGIAWCRASRGAGATIGHRFPFLADLCCSLRDKSHFQSTSCERTCLTSTLHIVIHLHWCWKPCSNFPLCWLWRQAPNGPGMSPPRIWLWQKPFCPSPGSHVTHWSILHPLLLQCFIPLVVIRSRTIASRCRAWHARALCFPLQTKADAGPSQRPVMCSAPKGALHCLSPHQGSLVWAPSWGSPVAPPWGAECLLLKTGTAVYLSWRVWLLCFICPMVSIRCLSCGEPPLTHIHLHCVIPVIWGVSLKDCQ